jgi:WD40 repeat protein
MSDQATDTPSVVERTRPVAVDGPVVAAHFLGETAAFALAEETIVLAAADSTQSAIAVHGGAILCASGNGTRLITGGDDGKVVATTAAGGTDIIATDAKRRWVDSVACGPDGAVAWSTGKQAFVRNGKGEIASVDAPSSIGGIAFAPKGFRVALAHYGGATLWFPNARDAKPEFLDWKGSHLAATFSPDGKFLVTAMQEPTLHGWRLVDSKHMRMSGYAAKVRSMNWSADGKYLATSGSDQIILWPFGSKDGPMGKQPLMLAPSDRRVTVVACHPNQDIVAAGFDNGLILLVRIGDGAEIIARTPASGPVSALAWNTVGSLLAFGTEAGQAGIVNLA